MKIGNVDEDQDAVFIFKIRRSKSFAWLLPRVFSRNAAQAKIDSARCIRAFELSHGHPKDRISVE